MLAQITLTPTESKKLIAKAVAQTDEVKRAVREGMVVLHPSSSTYFVVEEITGAKPKTNAWVCGVVAPRGTCGEVGVQLASQLFAKAVTTDPGEFPHSWVIKNKECSAGHKLSELLQQMGPKDVYIKGVNALDLQGNVGVLVANLVEGGTIGRVLSAQRKNSFNIIWPVGLEKLIPISISEASKEAKRATLDYAMGLSAGLFPCSGGKKVDEMDAIKLLSGATALPIAAGGLGGAEGAVTLIVKGNEGQVKKAIHFIEQSKGARLPQLRLSNCHDCLASIFGMCKFPVGDKHWINV